MILKLLRVGGFAGTRLQASVDTSQLSDEDAERIDDLVRRLDFGALERQARGTLGRPDEFEYDLTVIEGDRQRRVRLRESALTPELRTVVDLLVRLARGR